jgi:hypothetical protein
MKNQLLKNTAFALTVGLGFLATQSCQKEALVSIKSLTADEAVAQIKVADDLFNEMLNLQNDLSSRGSTNDFGGELTFIDNASPKQLITNYGSGVVGSDGKTRSGKVVVSYLNDELYTIGNKIEAKFENFKINDNMTAGTMSIHNVGFDVNKHLAFKVTTTATQQSANGKVSIKSTNKVSITEGFDTPRTLDDVIQFDGKMTGVLTSGEKFEISYPTPLVRKRSVDCNQTYISGIAQINVESQSTRIIDYGNGNCDNLAVETVDGVSKTITIN